MKTPREMLLEKHRSIGPRLDAVRREALGEVRATAVGTPEEGGSFASRLWRELFWSCRRVWFGLAAVWVVILVMQVAARETTTHVAKGPAPSSDEVIASLKANQHRIMAELGMDVIKPEVAEPRDPVTRPRSERDHATAVV